jgi:glycine oxidase
MDPNEGHSADVVVVGAGAIGLCVARALSKAGRSVTVVDPTPGRGAIWAAAGMLAPASEAHFGHEPLVPLLSRAASRWPGFVDELGGGSDDLGFRAAGSVVVGADAGDRDELARIERLQRSLGLEVVDLSRDQLQALEPALAPSLRFGLRLPGDLQVDPRRVVAALLAELEHLAVSFVAARVTAVQRGRFPVVLLEGGSTLRPHQMVLCPGAHLEHIDGLEALGLPPIRPVKGHILRLTGAPLLTHTIRATVKGRSVYFVPRVDGQLVVGASSEERGFDTRVQVGEVHRLLDDARRVVPGVDELELSEVSVGLRPGSPDDAPTIEAFDGASLVVAVGHHRNGVLLAPLSAEVVVALLQGHEHPDHKLFRDSHG